MSAEPCQMAPLVEARHDGRLGAREAVSVERHLASCGPCTQLWNDLARLREEAQRDLPPVSPLEHQRGRLRLLREAALPAPSPRRPAAHGKLALGVLVLAPLALWLLAAPRPQPDVLLKLHVSIAQRAPAAAPPAERTETTVHPSEGARFTHQVTGNVESFALDSGSLDLSVRRLGPDERFVVQTTDAEVEVRGTVFRVEARAGHIQAVDVTEGKVEVRFANHAELLLPGASWRPPSEPASASRVPRARASDARRSARGASAAASGAPEKAAGTESALAEGVRLTERGDYGAAAEKLTEFQHEHPDDEGAEDAAFLAIVALQRAGRRAEAAEAAKSYLARYPHGYRRAEAEAIAGP